MGQSTEAESEVTEVVEDVNIIERAAACLQIAWLAQCGLTETSKQETQHRRHFNLMRMCRGFPVLKKILDFKSTMHLPCGDPKWKEYILDLDLYKNLDVLIELRDVVTSKLGRLLEPGVAKELVEHLTSDLFKSSEFMTGLLSTLGFENFQLQEELNPVTFLGFGVQLLGKLSTAS
jgi:hypothetical protein